MATILTAPTINNVGLLFERYKEQFPTASEEAFYRFLLAPTPERKFFLEQNCSKSYFTHDSQVVEVKLYVL